MSTLLSLGASPFVSLDDEVPGKLIQTTLAELGCAKAPGVSKQARGAVPVLRVAAGVSCSVCVE